MSEDPRDYLPTWPGTYLEFAAARPPRHRRCWRCRLWLRWPPWRRHWGCRKLPPLKYLELPPRAPQ